MECLNEIIGIIDADCPCITTGLTPEEIALLQVSKSGLFLDELEGGVNMRGLTNVDSCRNFAQLALTARKTAVKKLYADMLAALSKKYQTGKTSFVGALGRPSYTGNITANSRYQFMILNPKEKSDAVLTITGLRLILNQAINTTVKILRVIEGGNQGEEIFTADLLTVANTFTPVPLGAASISLPLTVNREKVNYYVMWDRGIDGTAVAKDIKPGCLCPGGTGYEPFVDVYGFEAADINMLTAGSKTQYTQGFSMDVEIRCVQGNLICREFDNENAIAVVMAWCVMYKAGELLIEELLKSNEVTRYTMMNREALYGKRNHFRKEYEDRIPYLASTIDVSSSDCYVCRDTKMFFQGILV